MKSKKCVALYVVVVVTVLFALFTQAGGKEMVPKEQFEGGLAGPFSGKLLMVIYKAIPVLESKGGKLEDYNVYVSNHEAPYQVSFENPKKAALMTGGGALVVRINKETLEVEGSHYSR